MPSNFLAESTVMCMGMECFFESTSNAETWSACSWVINMASISEMSEPILRRAQQRDLALFPASMRILVVPDEMKVELPPEPE